MNDLYDYKRFAILYVDDEEKSLKQFARVFDQTFRVLTAPNAAEGYRLLEDHQDEIGLVMSDQRMPGEQGVQFLERARRLRPQIIRILATAYADLQAAIAAVNSGAIYKYVDKPWDVPSLETTLKRGLEFFIVQLERDLLLREKLSVLHRLVVTDRVLSLGVLGAGLGHQLRHALEAVRQFLELAPEGVGRGDVDLNRLRDPNFWQDFHRSVQDRFKSVVGLLDTLVIPTPPAFNFHGRQSVRDAVDAAVRELAGSLEPKNLQVSNRVPADLPVLHVDTPRFARLFPLILQYQAAALPAGSIIRFEAEVPPAGATGAPDRVNVFITNNGTSAPAEAALSLFDPFQVRRGNGGESGTLLLAFYLIVFHHAGTVKLAHGSGGGMALTLSLPIQPMELAAGDQAAEFLSRAIQCDRLWDSLLSQNLT